MVTFARSAVYISGKEAGFPEDAKAALAGGAEMSTPEQTQQALAAQEKPKTLQSMIEASAKELGRALPEHMKPERLVRIALTCIRQTPDLARCTPESFLGALFTAAQIGVEPIAGRAYLLPFNNSRKKPDGSWHTVKECQFVLGYKGVVDLFYRHEKAINLAWGVVHEKDYFEMRCGTSASLTHEVDYKLADRGPVLGFWAMANLVNGGKPFHYMTRGECWEHGKKHSKTYNKKTGEWFDSSPWLKDEEAMCLKTVLTQGAKIWPISVELQRALDQDESSREIVPELKVDNVLDIPSDTEWDKVEKDVEEKNKNVVTPSGSEQIPSEKQS